MDDESEHEGTGQQPEHEGRDHRPDAEPSERDQRGPYRSPLLPARPVQFEQPRRPDAEHGTAHDTSKKRPNKSQMNSFRPAIMTSEATPDNAVIGNTIGRRPKRSDIGQRATTQR